MPFFHSTHREVCAGGLCVYDSTPGAGCENSGAGSHPEWANEMLVPQATRGDVPHLNQCLAESEPHRDVSHSRSNGSTDGHAAIVLRAHQTDISCSQASYSVCQGRSEMTRPELAANCGVQSAAQATAMELVADYVLAGGGTSRSPHDAQRIARGLMDAATRDNWCISDWDAVYRRLRWLSRPGGAFVGGDPALACAMELSWQHSGLGLKTERAGAQ